MAISGVTRAQVELLRTAMINAEKALENYANVRNFPLAAVTDTYLAALKTQLDTVVAASAGTS